MDNYQIAEIFSLLSKLTDIHAENNFKAKSYAIAAFHIEKLPEQLSETPREKIALIKGIGESSAKKIIEILETGSLKVLQELNEKNVIETIEFYLSNQGSNLYPQVEAVEPQITAYLQKLFSPENVYLTGSFKRQLEIIDELEYVINSSVEHIKPKFQTANPPELLEENADNVLYKLLNGLKLRLYSATENFEKKCFFTAGSPEFVNDFIFQFPVFDFSGTVLFFGLEIIFSAWGAAGH